MAHLLVKHPKTLRPQLLENGVWTAHPWVVLVGSINNLFMGPPNPNGRVRFVSCQLLGDTQVCMGPFEWVLSPLEISWIGGKLYIYIGGFFGFLETGAHLANFNQVTSDF